MWLPVLTAYLVFFILLLLFAFHLYNKKYSDKWWMVWMFVCIIAMWGLYWLCMLGVFGDDKPADANSWITAGTFGDMFGALNCLFTSLAFGGTLVNIVRQRERSDIEHAEHRHDNIMMMILQLPVLVDHISFPKNDGASHAWGAEAAQAMLESVHAPLSTIQEGLKNRRDGKWVQTMWNEAETTFKLFLSQLSPIRPISSQLYFILLQLVKSEGLSTAEKNDLTAYAIFNITPVIRQILNFLYLDARISQNLDSFHDLFNEGLTYRQLQLHFPGYSGETYRIFVESLKAQQLCLRAGKYNKEERSQWATRPKFYD